MVSRKDDRTYCFIDIGQVHTELIILKGTQLIFTRKIPVCGDDFTKALMSAIITDKGKVQLSFEEAEKIKKDVGIPSDPGIKASDKISISQISALLRGSLENFTNEVGRCFDYYREETGSGRIDAVFLFGGGAALNGFTKVLADELGIEVKVGDSFHGINISKEVLDNSGSHSYRMNLAIGCALSMEGGINLLPVEIKDEKKKLVQRSTFEAVATAIILIFVLVYSGLNIKLNNYQKKINAARLELSSLEPQLKKTEAIILANSILAKEPQWEDVFMELSNLIPDEIHVTALAMREDVITIRGVISSQDGEQVLSDFMLTLERGLFDKVRLVDTKKLPEESGTEFVLTCWIDYEK